MDGGVPEWRGDVDRTQEREVTAERGGVVGGCCDRCVATMRGVGKKAERAVWKRRTEKVSDFSRDVRGRLPSDFDFLFSDGPTCTRLQAATLQARMTPYFANVRLI